MKTRSAVIILILLTIVSCASAQIQQNSLKELYQQVFIGSYLIHVPEAKYLIEATTRKCFEIPLSGRFPFRYGTIQGAYYYPAICNDDENALYFMSVIGQSVEEKDRDNVAFKVDKKTMKTEILSVEDIKREMQGTIFGYYTKKESGTDGVMRLDLENDYGHIRTDYNAKGYGFSIISPKDIDNEAEYFFLTNFVPAQSMLSFKKDSRDMEILVYNSKKKEIAADFVLPFTDSYLPINIQTFPMQSVSGNNYVYLILNDVSINSDVTMTLPNSPRKWHVLIYNFKDDSLYSVWHSMIEDPNDSILACSYYLGIEGLYFEILRKGKLEIFLVELCFASAQPLKEYETVDLLWNNRGFRQQWERQIQQAKLKDINFKAVWK
jgi:hypothetical protein